MLYLKFFCDGQASVSIVCLHGCGDVKTPSILGGLTSSCHSIRTALRYAFFFNVSFVERLSEYSLQEFKSCCWGRLLNSCFFLGGGGGW
jgi:hypothetical protein